MQTEINFSLGKNGGHMPSSLSGRSIIVVRQARMHTCTHARRQADKILAVYKILKFANFNSKAHYFRMFEWIYGANSFIPIKTHSSESRGQEEAACVRVF